MKELFSKIVVSGVGLLGGSVARASMKNKIAEEIVGVCRSETSRERVQISGAVHRAVLSFDEAFENINDARYSERTNKPVLVVAAVPVNSIAEELAKALRAIETLDRKQLFLLTDVGSAKTQVVKTLQNRSLPDKVTFIGSHPIAGSEKTGVEASSDSLFQGHRTVLTPDCSFIFDTEEFSEMDPADLNESDQQKRSQYKQSLDLLQEFWKRLGSGVMIMRPEIHDRILARTSHLPQLLSSALSYLVTEEEHTLCGTGFSGMTRLAGSSPIMWNDIFKANRDSVLDALEAYIDILEHWKNALRREDGTERLALLKEAKKKRDALGSRN